eukprot:Platyproteum_vivax@DN8178_c0_g1_i1.p1
MPRQKAPAEIYSDRQRIHPVQNDADTLPSVFNKSCLRCVVGSVENVEWCPDWIDCEGTFVRTHIIDMNDEGKYVRKSSANTVVDFDKKSSTLSQLANHGENPFVGPLCTQTEPISCHPHHSVTWNHASIVLEPIPVLCRPSVIFLFEIIGVYRTPRRNSRLYRRLSQQLTSVVKSGGQSNLVLGWAYCRPWNILLPSFQTGEIPDLHFDSTNNEVVGSPAYPQPHLRTTIRLQMFKSRPILKKDRDQVRDLGDESFRNPPACYYEFNSPLIYKKQHRLLSTLSVSVEGVNWADCLQAVSDPQAFFTPRDEPSALNSARLMKKLPTLFEGSDNGDEENVPNQLLCRISSGVGGCKMIAISADGMFLTSVTHPDTAAPWILNIYSLKDGFVNKSPVCSCKSHISEVVGVEWCGCDAYPYVLCSWDQDGSIHFYDFSWLSDSDPQIHAHQTSIETPINTVFVAAGLKVVQIHPSVKQTFLLAIGHESTTQICIVDLVYKDHQFLPLTHPEHFSDSASSTPSTPTSPTANPNQTWMTVLCLGWSLVDPSTLYGGSADGNVLQWTIDTQNNLSTVYVCGENLASCGLVSLHLMPSTDSKEWLLFICEDNMCRLAHLQQDTLTLVRVFGNSCVSCAVISPNATLVATGTTSGEINVWSLTTGQLIKNPPRIRYRTPVTDIEWVAAYFGACSDSIEEAPILIFTNKRTLSKEKLQIGDEKPQTFGSKQLNRTFLHGESRRETGMRSFANNVETV